MSITLLISTRNRSGLLDLSLSRLEQLTMPDEIIVVDDGGADHCEWVCEGHGAHHIRNENPSDTNPCLARNIGIRAATSDEILVSEPECFFLTDVVGQMIEAREEFPIECLFGATWHTEAEGAGMESARLIGTYPFFTLYRRDWLLAVGGYDEALPGRWGFDDVDLNQRLGEAGHMTLLLSQVRALHMWHEPRIDAKAADANEAIVRAKRWPQDIVANAGREWGAVLCPST